MSIVCNAVQHVIPRGNWVFTHSPTDGRYAASKFQSPDGAAANVPALLLLNTFRGRNLQKPTQQSIELAIITRDYKLLSNNHPCLILLRPYTVPKHKTPKKSQTVKKQIKVSKRELRVLTAALGPPLKVPVP